MIYVAVGTQKFQFNRLLKALDELVECGVITDEVFAQVGHCTYCPTNYKYQDFLSKEEFDKYIDKCDLLITHSGVATIIAGLKHNKPVIVIPRLVKYGEHVDNHQVQIADSFMKKNLVMKYEEDADLGKLIVEAKVHQFDKYISQRGYVVSTIKDYINSIQ